MTDSDSDGLTNNVFAFQNENTVLSAKGPNTNLTNITGISFRNNVFSSTMQMPHHFERRRYAASSYDQRSISNRRDTSPMSVRSTCNMKQRNFNYSSISQGINAPRSFYNGRSQSPMSIRSTGTTASMSAVDIVNVLENEHFNKYDLNIIKAACHKFLRHRIGKKIDKRRYRKMRRHRNGSDSCEQDSDSSLSSDDQSVRTSNYKDNMSSCRSTVTNISNFKKKIKDSNMFKDCTDYFKNNSIQNAAGGSINSNTSQASHQSTLVGSNMPLFRNMSIPKFHKKATQENPSGETLRDRFTNRFQLPSQRFNRSLIPTSIPENGQMECRNEINSRNGILNKNSARNIEMDSDEEIFSNSILQNPSNTRKRSIDSEDIILPKEKRIKTLSPCKNSLEAQKLKVSSDKLNDFVFTKPVCPAKKSLKKISKDADNLSDANPQTSIPPEIQQTTQEKPAEEEKEEVYEENSTCNSIDISMRPSFIKRKLFTQKVDLLEKANLSMDNLNSPQNSMYGALQKEKHKTRKLQQATTQSCLNRDVHQDDNNLLDLIHKIVPIDQMNVTTQTNKTGSQTKNITDGDNDKWDASSIISTCENDKESETYTDEEIFNSTQKELQTADISKEHTNTRKDKVTHPIKNTPKKPSPAKTKIIKILVDRLPNNIKQPTVKQFWDTDFDSDMEFQPLPRTVKLNSKENHRPDIQPKKASKTQPFSSMSNSKKITAAPILSSQNCTFDTTHKSNSTLRIRCHRAPKRNKLDQNTDDDAKSGLIESESKKKEHQANGSKDISKPEPVKITKIESKKSKETPSIKDNKKSPKGKKQTSKTEKQNQSIQKPNKKQDNSKTEGKTNKKETNAKKTPQKVNNNSNKQDVAQKKTQTKKLDESKVLNKAIPKSKNAKKTDNKAHSSIIEENNNKTKTPLRSCRKNPKIYTTVKAVLNQNDSMNRTLRSRTCDLSTPNKINTRSVQKDIRNYTLSDVSFSPAEKNILSKRAVIKDTSHLFNGVESDVSFSLTPIPRKTRGMSASRNNTINSTPLKKNPPRSKQPNKRYEFW